MIHWFWFLAVQIDILILNFMNLFFSDLEFKSNFEVENSGQSDSVH